MLIIGGAVVYLIIAHSFPSANDTGCVVHSSGIECGTVHF